MMSTDTQCPQCQEALSHQRRLITGLLLWTTLLSLGQAVAIALFITRSIPEQKQLEGITGREFSVDFQNAANNNSGTIKWRTEEGSGTSPEVSDDPELLSITQDGRYFLYTQVTLQSHAQKQPYTVRVWKFPGDILLERIFTIKGAGEQHTTGLLGRQVLLVAGNKLMVTCSPPALINTTDTATFLGAALLEPY